MKLTPMDINNKEFKKGLRGYNVEEVDEFLDEVIENYEELYKENSKLKEKLARANEQIEHFEKIESTIQNTLLLAQNAAEQAKESSQKEAEFTIKNANETAQKILDKAHNDVIQINDEYDKVKQEFIMFRAKFRNFMDSQLRTFDELEKELTKNYSVAEPVDDEVDKIEEKEAIVHNQEEDILIDEIDEIKSFYVENE